MGYVYLPKGRAVWMMKYYRRGRPVRMSTGETDEQKATQALQAAEVDSRRGLPTGPDVGRLTFDQGVKLIEDEYQTNARDSASTLEQRIRVHLQPVFGGWKLVDITTAELRAYIKLRLDEHAARATINRELRVIGRIFKLAQQTGKLLYCPHIPTMRERNTRTGFFERETVEAVIRQLPEALRSVVRFAHITGWRIDSEILPLEWRQVDFDANEVRLFPETTKNDEGRVFPLTRDLRAILDQQWTLHQQLKEAGHVCPFVFVRLVGKRGGKAPRVPKRILRFNKAWRKACKAAGAPGRIPHDLRRTAVRNLERAGVPRSVAMKLTGHKTESVYRRYDIVSRADLDVALGQLDHHTRRSRPR